MEPDVLVIGGGLYGAVIATGLGSAGLQVTLVEREEKVLARASTLNQARIHGGYHYPRSIATGLGSRRHYQRFQGDFAEAVVEPRVALYAVAKRGSLTTAGQFRSFCERIGAPCRPAAGEWSGLFDRSLVSEVFEVEEAVFDAGVMARLMLARLEEASVDVRLSTEVASLEVEADHVKVSTSAGETIRAAQAVNCTYSEINDWSASSTDVPIMNEWTEIALFRPPAELVDVAVTLIDGPFFSLLPFPARGAGVASLSHVRYTPHGVLEAESGGARPALDEEQNRSRQAAMLADASRYLPALAGAEYLTSAYEVKAVPHSRDGDDGRPIIYLESPSESPRVATVFGSKLDLVYDVLPSVESFVAAGRAVAR